MKIYDAWEEFKVWADAELSGPFRDLIRGKIEELENKHE